MFGFGKQKAPTPSPVETDEASSPGLFRRLKQGLARTRANLTDGLANLILGHKQIDDALLEDLEDVEEIRRAREEDEETIPWERVKADLDLGS